MEAARRNKPGNKPGTLFLNRNDPDSVNRHNEQVREYNNQLDLHRRLIDQADRAKERYEDALEKYNDKKADFEEKIRNKKETLKPALDQDILTALSKLQQLAYDNISNKANSFVGFLLIYFSKKTYVFLYDYIEQSQEQRTANEIFRLLDEMLDQIVNRDLTAIRNGMMQCAQLLFDLWQTANSLEKEIVGQLKTLPLQECKTFDSRVKRLLLVPLKTEFKYKDIVDPVKQADMSTKVEERKSEYEKFVQEITDLLAELEPLFDQISKTKEKTDSAFAKMITCKEKDFDPVSGDLIFNFSLFEPEQQERYLSRHKAWISGLLSDIESMLKNNLQKQLKFIMETALFTIPVKEMFETDVTLNFLENKKQLQEKKKELAGCVQTLDKTLDDINDLPRLQAQFFTQKSRKLLLLSLLPILNLGIQIPMRQLITRFLPAFSSNNPIYGKLKTKQLKQMQLFLYLHLTLFFCAGITALLTGPTEQIILACLSGIYAIGSLFLYLNRRRIF